MAEPLASFSGLATGLDTGALINSLMSLERRPINALQNKKIDIESISRRLTDIASELGNTNTILEGMNSRAEILKSKATSSSDAVTATVIGYPPLTQHTMTVSSLASSEITISDGMVSATGSGLFGVGDITMSIGGATGIAISVTAGDSLNMVAIKINESIDDAIAAVIFDGTDYHLQVIGSETGATEGAITFNEGGTLTLNTVDPANELVSSSDAIFTVDGHAMTRTSNDVTGAISGLSLELTEATGVAITVGVERDNAALESQVSSFVDKYNFLVSLIDKEFVYSGEARVGDSLSGDSTLRTLKDKLSTMAISEVPGLSSSVYNRLSALGIEITQTGSLEFDSAVLEAAIATDPDAVVEFFAGSADGSVDGFSKIFDTFSDAYTRSSDGIITIRTDGISDQVRDIDNRIDHLELRLDQFEERLRKQYASLETLVSGLQNQGNQMMSALGQF